jgi:hypothetical protein
MLLGLCAALGPEMFWFMLDVDPLEMGMKEDLQK